MPENVRNNGSRRWLVRRLLLLLLLVPLLVFIWRFLAIKNSLYLQVKFVLHLEFLLLGSRNDNDWSPLQQSVACFYLAVF